MPIDISQYSFDTGIVTIHYAEGPACGPPLVLLHGGSNGWQSFESIMPDLAEDWHLYAPDFRGHGRSGRVSGAYRLQDYTDDMIAFLQQRVSEPAIIFGHSLGGMVALLVAAQCPDQIRAVVVGDSPLTAARWLAHLKHSREDLIVWRDLAGGKHSVEKIREKVGNQWVAQNLYFNDPDMLSTLIDDPESAAAGFEAALLLPSIRCPVLLLQADPNAGGILTDAEVERGLALLYDPTHVRLEGVGHLLHIEQKDAALRAISGFLKTL
ncbi:MAG: alpha/beta hydrolase [Anaerolineales bacterium]|jgi:pimeloyl-ACP methyl ester carboxylesterase